MRSSVTGELVTGKLIYRQDTTHAHISVTSFLGRLELNVDTLQVLRSYASKQRYEYIEDLESGENYKHIAIEENTSPSTRN